MALQFYNSLSHKIETFQPLREGLVSFYSCGPTVYDFAHIGNMRAYIFADIIKRVLLYSGFTVNHTMNYTDVEDKIIIQAQKQHVSLKDLTDPFIKAFQEDIASVHILPATQYTKATDYIDTMVSIIEKLLDKGYAYKAEDGSIYFNVAQDIAYGKLVTIDKAMLKNNAKGRMKSDEYDKESAQDFALWKRWTDADGDIFWETSLGKGRPGWHIECSAMALATLGETIDIHTGGVDNIFPHHENEIAQSECSSGKTFSRFFMHNEHMQIESKKMSKSLGNFFTLRDIVEKGFNPLAFRYWLLTSHYRTKINFSLKTLQAAQTAFDKLRSMVLELSVHNGGKVIEKEATAFTNFIQNDLGTAESISLIWLMLKNPKYSKADVYATIINFDKVLGLGLSDISSELLPDTIQTLVLKRDEQRKDKNWEQSDILRKKLETNGYEVLDTATGTKIRKK